MPGMGALTASLTQIHDFGTQIASPGRRFVACNFLDKVLIAHPDAPTRMWNAISPSTGLLPGLPIGATYRGVNAFQGFVILWSGITLKWSDQNDYTLWIPVGTTASSFVFELLKAYTLGVVGIESDYLIVDQNPTGLQPKQFLRIDSDPYYTFFQVGTVLPATGFTGTASGFTQTVPAGSVKDIFLQAYVAYGVGTRIYFASNPTNIMQVTTAAVAGNAATLVLAAAFTSPPVGTTVMVTTTTTPVINPGTYVSIGPAATPGQDIYLVQTVNQSASQVTLLRMGVGSSGAAGHLAGEFIIGQPSVQVTNISSNPAVSVFAEPINEVYGFTVIPLDLSGAAPLGTVFPIGTEIFTIDANGAGETQNTGSAINGEILWVDTISDYAYIFKNRSIQSVQYTGVGNGTFFIRPEITDEGLVGNYSFVKVGLDRFYFWGQKGIYCFLGGNTLQSIAQQHYKQLKTELDLSRADQIVGYHNEKDFEIWFIYPRIDQNGVGSLRIFIFNYVENSVTIDDYTTSLQSLTAMGRIDWNEDLTWNTVEGTWSAPISFSPTTTWADEASDAYPSKGVIGIASNTPPLTPTMSSVAARDLYYSAHPADTYIEDPLEFLNFFNQYWNVHGSWPAIATLQARSTADQQIAAAFGYQTGVGLNPYFLAPPVNLNLNSAPGLVVYDNGNNDRLGDPIASRYESVDHDGGDPLAWKYADTQWFSIQTKSKISIAMPMLIYIGARANYDDDIVWSAPIVLNVQGNKNYVTKTNVKASGRFFRIKVVAATPGMEFRISQCKILGRLGATY